MTEREVLLNHLIVTLRLQLAARRVLTEIVGVQGGCLGEDPLWLILLLALVHLNQSDHGLVQVNVCLVCYLVQTRSFWRARGSIIHQDVLVSQQAILDHIVGYLKGQHRVLDWVELVDMDDAQKNEFSAEGDLDLECTFLKIGWLLKPR